MQLRTVRAGLVVLATGVALATGVVAGATPSEAVVATPPTIVVKPHSVMVDTTAKVVGKGFARHSTVTVVECAMTTWVVMTNPCDTTNAVTVHTNGHGAFRTPFTVQTCPGAAAAGPGGLAFLCYLGVARPSGIDTMSLQPYTGVVVTYP